MKLIREESGSNVIIFDEVPSKRHRAGKKYRQYTL